MAEPILFFVLLSAGVDFRPAPFCFDGSYVFFFAFSRLSDMTDASITSRGKSAQNGAVVGKEKQNMGVQHPVKTCTIFHRQFYFFLFLPHFPSNNAALKIKKRKT